MRRRIAIAAVLTGVLVSIMWTASTGARWYPSRRKAILAMLRDSGVGPGTTLYDLGSGDGRILITAARRFGARAIGVEIDPARCLISKTRILIAGVGRLATVRCGNMFSADITDADVVVCFLLQPTNERLEAKLLAELRPGAKVVSCVHTFPHLPLVSENLEEQVRVYEIPPRT